MRDPASSEFHTVHDAKGDKIARYLEVPGGRIYQVASEPEGVAWHPPVFVPVMPPVPRDDMTAAQMIDAQGARIGQLTKERAGLIVQVNELKNAVDQACDLAEDANGEEGTCPYNAPIGEGIKALRAKYTQGMVVSADPLAALEHAGEPTRLHRTVRQKQTICELASDLTAFKGSIHWGGDAKEGEAAAILYGKLRDACLAWEARRG